MKKINHNPLLKFMLARHSIYLKRHAGDPQPWTKDPILTQYKFTNVYRQLDRVTVWVNRHISKPYAKHDHLWLMLCIARQINHPASLEDLMAQPRTWFAGRSWDCDAAISVLDQRSVRKEQVFTGAYIITNGGLSLPKTEVVLEHYILPLWENRAAIESHLHGTLQEAHEELTRYQGWGGFMAYEVVCDLRYTRYLRHATDVCTWAHAGPGAKRGLRRLLGLEIHSRKVVAFNTAAALERMRELHTAISKEWPYSPPLELREIEHSLCEFDKYERTRIGAGRPRSLYKPQDGGRLP